MADSNDKIFSLVNQYDQPQTKNLSDAKKAASEEVQSNKTDSNAIKNEFRNSIDTSDATIKEIKENASPEVVLKKKDESVREMILAQKRAVDLTKEEFNMLSHLSDNDGTIDDFLSNVSTIIYDSTGKAPFKTQPEVDNRVKEKPVSKLQEELFPSDQTQEERSPEDFDKNSAEYKAMQLGPITSRLDKKPSTGRRVTPEEAEAFAKKVDKQLSEIDPENLSELDSYMLTQLPSETMTDQDVVTVRRKDICPVDLEVDETGNVSPFFNWEKTCANLGHPEWTEKLKLTEEKTQTQFWKNVAKMQYNAYLKYHNLSESDKDKKDKSSKMMKILIPSATAFFIIAALVLSYIPKMNLSSGLKAIESGEYESAQNILCNKINNKAYCSYANAMVLTSEGEYDKAVEIVDELISTSSASIKYDLEETKNEILYKQGLALLNEEKYAQGLLVLRKIPNYKDVKDIYYRTCYDVAEANAESNKDLSLRYYYMANEYKDAKEKFQERAEEIYLEGLSYYYSANYPQAQESFKILETFDYKDSADMIAQATYRAGLDAYLRENYEVSNSFFTQIPFYKDASALIMSSEELRRPLSDDEIAELIASTREANPTWIMKVVIDSEGQTFTLYNAETFKFNASDADYASSVELFISQHGGEEAIDIARQTKNYQSFIQEEPDIIEVFDEQEVPAEENAESSENNEESASETQEESAEGN